MLKKLAKVARISPVDAAAFLCGARGFMLASGKQWQPEPVIPAISGITLPGARVAPSIALFSRQVRARIIITRKWQMNQRQVSVYQ